MFQDEAELKVQAGRGGDGIIAFRREKFVPRGGPSGGDGGNGGCIILVADTSISSLATLAHSPVVKAENGINGQGSNKTGRRGENRILKVPVGTLVHDAEMGNLLKDLDTSGAQVIVANGGLGGRGNARFATAERRTPRYCEEGKPGESRRLRLELKLIADVGLIGLPNAGKSTFISRVSHARPKVASYPFTTLSPVLGIVELDYSRTFVLADLPGIIEGAHAGHGLGDRFLRHVERTRFLLHLVDCSSTAEDPVEAYRIIRQEIGAYSAVLAERESLVVATKLDDPAAEERAQELAAAVGQDVARISSVTGKGLKELIHTLAAKLFPVD